ncbi:NAD(P)-binding domain-containing protein [Sorangium sp. So ce291]|uniref:NAD(P)-binding domain-containing protein n=1 Tax=Sorangium sp. So ce291 TaxID=3133294 RepID=UPI003F617E7B
MKIGVIGAGHVGAALTRGLTELGHDVLVASSRGPHPIAEDPPHRAGGPLTPVGAPSRAPRRPGTPSRPHALRPPPR